MVVATATPSGEPASRAVLAKAADDGGVVFYTNLTSDKSRDLLANPRAAATFPWIGLQRQVHFRGTVSRVSDEEASGLLGDAGRGRHRSAAGPARSRRCWPTGPRWRCCSTRRKSASAAEDSTGERPVPLPPFWGGWRITPATVEFWQGRIGRLHDRLRYRDTGDGWVVERLAP